MDGRDRLVVRTPRCGRGNPDNYFRPSFIVFLVLVLFPSLLFCALRENTCDEGHTESTIQSGGQALIVGVFSFHNKGSGKYGCGETNTVSMQAYEAIRWTLDLLNKKGEYFNGQYLTDSYVPGVLLGMVAKDYCDQPSHVNVVLQEAISKIDGENCNLPPGRRQTESKMFLGVIGASSDTATVELAEYTTQHKIPLVTYIASTSRLSDGNKYPYIVRTVPAEKPLLSVLVEVLERLNWIFVTVVYTDDPDTIAAFMQLRERMSERNLCLTAAISTPSQDLSTASMEKVLSQVGSYSDGRLSLDTSKVFMFSPNRTTELSSLPISLCPNATCQPCLGSFVDIKYFFRNGDVILTSFFSLHSKGDLPFSCGLFTTDSAQMQYLEAVLYAIDNLKRLFPSLLPGVKLGTLILDDCSSSSSAISQVSDLQHGRLMVVDSLTRSPLQPRTISGYLGLSDTWLTVPLAETMDRLERPFVGYTAMGYQMKPSTNEFPFYLNPLQLHSTLMRVLSQFLRNVGWKYIQVLYSEDSYGENGRMELIKEAAKYGICVVASHSVDKLQKSTELINALRRNPNAKPVVVLVNSKESIRRILESIRTEAAGGKFTFIGLDSWGTSDQIVKGFETEADGTLIFRYKTAAIAGFQNYLDSLDVQNHAHNPWFIEWFQDTFKCALTSADVAKHGQLCSATFAKSKITSSPWFELDPRALFVTDAVYAFAHGLDSSLREVCGQNYTGVCSKFLTSRDSGEILVKNIKAAKFRDENQHFFSFDKNGFGNIPFEIFNYNSKKYDLVGDYSLISQRFSLNENSLKLFGGASVTSVRPSCKGKCISCQYMSNEQPAMFIPGDLLIAAMFDIHSADQSPFVCGPMRIYGGFQNTEAFAFALDWVNRGLLSDVSLNDITLGGIAFDGCSTPARAKSITLNFNHGLLNTSKLEIPDVKISHTMGWFSYDSGSTKDMALIAQDFNVPIISPGATSPDLLNKQRFTTFFRTIPSDQRTLQAMANLVKELGFTYVITLNAPDVGNRDARDEFHRLAGLRDVCIAASYEFITDGTYKDIIYHIVRSSTRVVVVFSEPDHHITALLKAKQTSLAAQDIIFLSSRPWYGKVKVPTSVYEKSIMFQTKFPILQEFKSWLQQKTPSNSKNQYNPWFHEYFEIYYGCFLGTNCTISDSLVDNRFEQNHQVVPTINAVFSLAKGIQMTLQQKCGVSYKGICDKYLTDLDTRQTIMSNMDRMALTTINGSSFRFTNREVEGVVEVSYVNNGVIRNMAEYSGKSLDYLTDKNRLINDYRLVPSTCITSCSKCEQASKTDNQFVFSSGDFTVVGLFDIHKKGPTPFSCGAINDEQGYQLVEAFNYAVDYVNSNKGIFANILRGVTIGSLAVDVCQSPSKAGNIVTNLQNKNAHLFDNSTNTFIDPADFQVYVGPFDSESSLRVADILTKLGIPQISYGATSAELSSDRYPFFSRTVPSDSKQARAFVSFLKRYQIKYVQLISTEDTIGRYGRQEFAKVAFENKICITQNISLPRNEFLTQVDAEVAINKLAFQDETTVVVLFVTNPRRLLISAEKNYNSTSRYLFMATDKWGADPDMLQDLDKLLSKRQIVIFDVETADLPDFDKYLDTKSTRTNNNKNWFNEYYEELYSCTTTSNTSSRFPTTCSGTSYRTLPIAPKYIQDPYVLFVVNAVFAAAIGIHGALQEVCGRNYDIICQRFISSDQRPVIQRNILSSQFIDPGLQPFYYMKGTDDSIRGYHIYEPVDTKQYINIGSYNETDNLKLDYRYNVGWSSSCSAASCPKCVFPPSEPTHYMTMTSPNDLNLVAIFDIHFADDKEFNQCGKLNTASGFQHALAFFYAIRNVNQNTRNRLASSLQLGGVALDTCSLPVTLGQDVYSLLTGSIKCRKNGINEVIFPPASIVGFVPKASSNAVPIADMLRDYDIMTLSPSATTTKLSDRSIYPHFLRTVPPDDLQAKVMMDILKKMQWTYVSSVYSDNEYGLSAIETFLKAADNDTAVCATKIISMPLNATHKEAKDIVERLNREAGARAVVLFVKDNQIRLLLQAAKDLDLVNRFVWIGSDTWGSNMYVVGNGLQETAAGAITIQIRSKVLKGFMEYMKQLTLEKHDGIPDDWFYDFYQDIHKCRLLFTDRAKNYDRICTRNETITDDKIQQDAFIFHTVLAVEMIAIGLNNIKECRQDTTVTVASCLALQTNKSALIYDNVRKSPWIDLHLSDKDIPSNFSFKFTEAGYGDIGYDIMNYRFNIYKNEYEYVKIGSWADSLSLNILDYRGPEYADIAIIPLSRCPVGSTCNCLNAKAEKVQQSTPQSDLLTSGENKIYIDPETGAFVNLRSLPSIGERFTSVWGTIATTLAALGAFFSFCLFCYFILFYPFRGGTTILGFTLIIAITGLYLMVIPFVAHATPEVCSIRRVFLGFFYALAYAVLVVKLLDAYRNIDKEELKYKNLAQPCGLLLITLFIVAIQLMIAIQWLILQPPEVVNVPVAGALYPRCAPHDFSDESLVISFVFVMFLLFISVLIASATWNNPNNCYESQWILGMVLLSIPVWVIWCLIATLSSYNVRDIAVAGGILVNATILLVIGPLYRLKLMKKDKDMQPSEKDDYYIYNSGINDDDVFYGNGYNTGPRIRDYPAYPQ
ncbi:Metabotropic glutamate receptor 3 [Octopus vulgaris]|uniref:Metabotropic glutamate receptor 3 n=1 Tax=Octopus vulgaris TaxID=6645 RepID=A0AA36FIP9_OCTVU|nr:Metabotropic glutamate receptor 3 [Octopus vulgaris]